MFWNPTPPTRNPHSLLTRCPPLPPEAEEEPPKHHHLPSDFLISTEFSLAHFDDFYDSLYRIFIPVSGWRKFS